MNYLRKIFNLIAIIAIIASCQDEDQTFGIIVAPTNIVVIPEIVGEDAANPNGDGSGLVNFTATADNALSYKYSFGAAEQNAPSGVTTFAFSDLGVNTYTVAVVAYGIGGVSTTTTIEVDVLATYSPPEDLLATLVGDGSKTWRIKSEQNAHFGLGPIGGAIPSEWFGAGPGEKSDTGMYDDRYIFNADGTFTHITNSTNDDPTLDPTGTVFGRVNLIDELGPHNETPNGADIENYPFQDYSESWVITAPGGVETINLTGLGFIGYYTGGSHKYEIFSRATPNEFILRTTDSNNEFDWWFIITSAEEGTTNGFQSIYDNLVWQDEFDIDGAPDPDKWTFDLGGGGWGNGEEQTYTNNAENVIVSDGSLKITAKAAGSSYTSARLKSENLYEFTYGRVEVRAKLPVSQGTWPAIWSLGANFDTVGWPASGEMDIMEQKGQTDEKDTISGTLHYPEMFGGNGNGSSTTVTTATTEFHNYTLEWTPDVIKIVVDNEVFHTVINSNALPFNSNFFFILNVAMGGTLGGTIDPAFTEDSMEIEYIRVYQQ